MKGKIKLWPGASCECANPECDAIFYDQQAIVWDDMAASLHKAGWKCDLTSLEFVWRCGKCAKNAS